MGVIKEFKDFAMKGNVIDLAIGVIIGAAFGKIVSSMVADILMPPIGKIMGGVDFKDLFINLDPSKRLLGGEAITSLAQAKTAGAAVIAYGQFINQCLDFLIVAFCVFVLVKAINVARRKPVPPAEPPPPTKEEMLLTEIRDLLKARSN